MPYITKRKFEESLKKCRDYLGKLKRTKFPEKHKYPDKRFKGDYLANLDFDEMLIKSHIDEKNDELKYAKQSLKTEIKWCTKNIGDLVKSKEETIFPCLIKYDKIHTYNWGKVNLKQFVDYMKVVWVDSPSID